MKAFYLNSINEKSVHKNLAKEEALAVNASVEEIDFGLRFWKNKESIVLGISDSASKNIPDSIIQNFIDTNHSNKIEIARRASGGGTVYHNFYNLNYSLFVNVKKYPKYYPVASSYKLLLDLVVQSLKSQGIDSVMAGKSDISIEKDNRLKKISGNSQFRKKNFLVLHGTLILSPKLIQKAKSVLKHPPEEPEYRKGRSHEEFLTNLPENFSVSEFMKSLKRIFFNEFSENMEMEKLNTDFFRKTIQSSRELCKTKYSNKDFIFNRQ
ncbi:MAG: lipoate--protein ligase family protein [Leptospiraceae bacterium]|nr:lipoate--protein ligase family protein [Leptospiraceae bacterium]